VAKFFTMKKNNEYNFNVQHLISWDDTSPAGTLNLTGLNIMLQRAAVEHAEQLGFGYQVMSKKNLSWVLVRMNIEILRLPNWREEVILTTWPRHLSTISAFRDYTLINKQSEELLCNASSEWLLIDLTTRRPQKMEEHRDLEVFVMEKNALSHKTPKIQRDLNYEDLFKIKSLYSSLDMNGHTNARKYIDWLDDAIYEVHGERKFSFLHMAYFHECKYNEEVIIQVGMRDNSVFQGLKSKNNQVAFRAKVEFKK